MGALTFSYYLGFTPKVPLLPTKSASLSWGCLPSVTKEYKQEVQETEGISQLDTSVLIMENFPGPAREREATPDTDREMPFCKLTSYGRLFNPKEHLKGNQEV